MSSKTASIANPRNRQARQLLIAAVLNVALFSQNAAAQTAAATGESSSSSGLSQIEERLSDKARRPNRRPTTVAGGVSVTNQGVILNGGVSGSAGSIGGSILIPTTGSTTGGGSSPIGPQPAGGTAYPQNTTTTGSGTGNTTQGGWNTTQGGAGTTNTAGSNASGNNTSTAADNSRAGTDGTGDMASSGSQELFLDPNGKDMLASWDGWSDSYEGYGRSPILFDPVDLKQASQGNNPEYRTDLTRKYPELSYYKNDTDKRSMRMVNIGVDKEIMKSKMTIYQTTSSLQTSVSNDEFARDNYLNMFKSLRGVANLTLSYLDKTVAAGLATTQAQVDATTTQDLMKQISWSSAKIANPEMSAIYHDTDEKVEACLFVLEEGRMLGAWNGFTGGLANFMGTGNVEHTRDYLRMVGKTMSDCPAATCGPKPSSTAGRYRYCVCCAEAAIKPNASAVENNMGSRKEIKENHWSLVERMFLGINAPQTSSATDDKNCYVRRVAQSFKELYGDQVYALGRIDTAGNPALAQNPFLRFEYPSLSPAQKINLIRNGVPDDATGAACRSGGLGGLWEDFWGTSSGTIYQGTLVCPIQDIMVTKGICPALVELLQRYPNVTDRTDTDLMALWLQASLGKVITPKDLEDLLNMGGYQSYELPLGASWKPRGALYTYLQNFCDAAAVSAFKRFHVRMKSLAYDHVTLNKNITEDNKRDFFGLIDRVDKYVVLAEQDVQAPEVARQMSIQLSIDAARLKEERQGAAMEATKNSTWINQVSSGIKGFGGR